MRRPTIFVPVRLLYAKLSSTGQNLSRGALALVRPAAVSTRYGIALSRQHRQLSQPVNAVQILALTWCFIRFEVSLHGDVDHLRQLAFRRGRRGDRENYRPRPGQDTGRIDF